MDTRTGDMYPTMQAALDAGVPADALVEVSGSPKAIETIREAIKATSKYVPHQGKGEIARRRRQAAKRRG